ncbi:MAG: GNAT family N-acetyltransferase [Halolamina sp.]
MELRPARETDIPGIRDVAARSLAASYADVLDAEGRQQAVEAWYGTEESPDAFATELGDDRTVLVVAAEEDEILGFAQGYLAGERPLVGQIEWLHVRPDRREHGIGSQLLDAIESALHDAGADRIESRVIEANEAGRTFYEQRGYEPTSTRRVELADRRMAELTLVADPAAASIGEAPTARRETADGETVVIAFDESERGDEGPFHPTYLDDDREQQYGWHCGNCDSLDVSVGSMDEFVCNECGNRRRAMRWDAVYGG